MIVTLPWYLSCISASTFRVLNAVVCSFVHRCIDKLERKTFSESGTQTEQTETYHDDSDRYAIISVIVPPSYELCL